MKGHGKCIHAIGTNVARHVFKSAFRIGMGLFSPIPISVGYCFVEFLKMGEFIALFFIKFFSLLLSFG